MEPPLLLATTTTPPHHAVELWNADTMEMLGTLVGHSEQVRNVCFSGDCLRIAAATNGNYIHVWDTRTRDLMESFATVGYNDQLQFNKESTLLLTIAIGRIVTDDGVYLYVWELSTKRLVLQLNRMYIGSAIFSADSQHIIAVIDSAVEVVSMTSEWGGTVVRQQECREAVTLLRHPLYSFGLYSTPHTAGILSLRNAFTNEVVAEYASDGTPCFNSEGTMLAISRMGVVEIWDAISNTVLVKLPAIGRVISLSFNSTSDRIAIVSNFARNFQIFAIPSGEILHSHVQTSGIALAVYQQRDACVVLM